MLTSAKHAPSAMTRTVHFVIGAICAVAVVVSFVLCLHHF
jgi:hypothetical protein